MELINRPLYMNRLKQLREREEVKILVGARGVGKSSLLDLFAQNLLASGVSRENIIRIDFDTFNFRPTSNYKDLYHIVAEQMSKDAKNFLLLDEVQRFKYWKTAVTRLKKDFDADIYITSSIMLPDLGDFSPIILNVLPLSLKEFQTFHKFPEQLTLKEKFDVYLKFGGMPSVALNLENISAAISELSNNFSASLISDVMIGSKIAEFELLRELIKKILEQVGTVNSYNNFSKMFDKNPPAVRTVENYIERLRRANIFYAVPVTDLKKNNELVRFAKYYSVDNGYRNLILSDTDIDDKVLENVIYLELLRLGVNVAASRMGKNIVLQTERDGDKMYINVVTNLSEEAYKTLRKIRNQFTKWIITSEENVSNSFDGIKVTNILDFLMSE